MAAETAASPAPSSWQASCLGVLDMELHHRDRMVVVAYMELLSNGALAVQVCYETWAGTHDIVHHVQLPVSATWNERVDTLFSSTSFIGSSHALQHGGFMINCELGQEDCVCVVPPPADAATASGAAHSAWDVCAAVPEREIRPDTAVVRVAQHSAKVLAVFPDDRLLVSRKHRHTDIMDVLVVEPDGSSDVRVGKPLHGNTWTAAVLPGDRLVTVTEKDGAVDTLRTWDMGHDGRFELLFDWMAHVDSMTPLSHTWIATATMHEVRVWDVTNGACVARLPTDSTTTMVALAEDLLAVGDENGDIGIWDVRGKTNVAELMGHDDSISRMQLLPDGRLISGSDDGTLRVWVGPWSLPASRAAAWARRAAALLCWHTRHHAHVVSPVTGGVASSPPAFVSGVKRARPADDE